MSAIHIEIYGSGEPLVMLHGWAMHSGLWRGLAQQLAKHYRVLCVDLPGHGGSDKLLPFNLQNIAEQLLGVISERPCCWLGWSLGGSIAMYIATHYPERVSRLAIVAGNPCFVGGKEWPGVAAQQLQHFAADLQLDCEKTLMRFLSTQVGKINNGRVIIRDLRKALAEYHVPETETLQGGLDILQTADFRSVLQHLHCQVLFVLGENDLLVPVETAAALRHLLPNAVIGVIGHSGHVPFLTHENAVVSTVCDFIG